MNGTLSFRLTSSYKLKLLSVCTTRLASWTSMENFLSRKYKFSNCFHWKTLTGVLRSFASYWAIPRTNNEIFKCENVSTHNWIVQLNLVIRNFLVTLKLFLNAKCSLFLWSKLTIGHGKWFLNTNLFLIKTFLITKFDCTLNFGSKIRSL